MFDGFWYVLSVSFTVMKIKIQKIVVDYTYKDRTKWKKRWYLVHTTFIVNEEVAWMTKYVIKFTYKHI